ncbi:cysteine desulfurase [Erysipelothrix sp. D19-032]
MRVSFVVREQAAIREAFASVVKANDTVLVHEAPVYSTTITSFEMLGIQTLSCNFNDLEELESTLRKNPTVQAVLVQYTRQQLADSYDMEQVITTIKNVSPDCVVITDDNYAVMKVPFTGAQLGADLSCFSMFKLLGPQGIGCVIGNQAYVETIRKFHYSKGKSSSGIRSIGCYAFVSLRTRITCHSGNANRSTCKSHQHSRC